MPHKPASGGFKGIMPAARQGSPKRIGNIEQRGFKMPTLSQKVLPLGLVAVIIFAAAALLPALARISDTSLLEVSDESASVASIRETGGCMPAYGGMQPGVDNTHPCNPVPQCPAEYQQYADQNRKLLDSASVETVEKDGYFKQSFFDTKGNLIGLAEVAILPYAGENVATNYYQVATNYKQRYLGTDILVRTMSAWKKKTNPPASMKFLFADINQFASGNRCYWAKMGGIRGTVTEGQETLPFHLVSDIP